MPITQKHNSKRKTSSKNYGKKFKYSLLPVELQNAIFSHIETEESLNLVQTNKRFRKYFLDNGPFPKRIQQIDLLFEENIYSGDNRLVVILNFKSGTHLRFSFGNQLLIEGGDTLALYPKQKATLWNQLNRIESAKVMNLDFELGKDSYEYECAHIEDELVELFSKNKIFPLIGRIAELHVDITYLAIAELLLKNIKPNPDLYCHLSIGRYDVRAFVEVQQYLKKYLAKDHLKNCKQVVISQKDPLNFSELFSLPQKFFAQMNLQKWGNFEKLAKSFLKNGIDNFEAITLRAKIKQSPKRREPKIVTVIADLNTLTESIVGLKGIESNAGEALEIERFFEMNCKSCGSLADFHQSANGYLLLNLEKLAYKKFFLKKQKKCSFVCAVTMTPPKTPSNRPAFIELQVLMKRFG